MCSILGEKNCPSRGYREGETERQTERDIERDWDDYSGDWEQRNLLARSRGGGGGVERERTRGGGRG